MKKLLFFVLFLVCSNQLKAQTFHQDTMYFFIRLQKGSDTITLDKPEIKPYTREWAWEVLVDTDRVACTGDINGFDINISCNKMNAGGSPMSTSLYDNSYFNRSIYPLPGGMLVQSDFAVYLSGDTGIWFATPKSWPEIAKINGDDRYQVRVLYAKDSLTTPTWDVSDINYVAQTLYDAVLDVPVKICDLWGAGVWNYNLPVNSIPPNTIASTVSYDSLGMSLPLSKGTAEFYKINSNSSFALQGSVNITNGSYTTNSFSQGKYKILIKPDSVIYSNKLAPTYYGNSLHWKTASDFCIKNYETINIGTTLKRLLPLPNGPNSIQGFVIDGHGPRKPGEPKRGAGVALEQIPGGSVAYRTTDNNGFYNFEDLPSGNYELSVNIAGKSMKAIYSTNLDASAADVDTAVFFANDTLIYTEDTQLTIDSAYASFGPEKRLSQNVSIYPNPNEGRMFIKYNAVANEVNEIKIFDYQGREVIRNIWISKKDGELNKEIDFQEHNCKAGMYFLEIKQNSQINRSTFIIK